MQKICILTINKDKYCVQNNVIAFLHAPSDHFIRPTCSAAYQRKYLTSQSHDSNSDLHSRHVSNTLLDQQESCHQVGVRSSWKSPCRRGEHA